MTHECWLWNHKQHNSAWDCAWLWKKHFQISGDSQNAFIWYFYKHLYCKGRKKSNHGRLIQSAISEQVFMIFGHCQNHPNQTFKRPYQPKKSWFKNCFCAKINYIVVLLVPNFYLSAWLSSFFLAFFLHVYGEPF